MSAIQWFENPEDGTSPWRKRGVIGDKPVINLTSEGVSYLAELEQQVATLTTAMMRSDSTLSYIRHRGNLRGWQTLAFNLTPEDVDEVIRESRAALAATAPACEHRVCTTTHGAFVSYDGKGNQRCIEWCLDCDGLTWTEWEPVVKETT